MQIILFLLIFYGYLTVIFSHITFTNLKCGALDKRFCEFQKCYIKAVNRSHKYIDIYVNMKQLPVDNIRMNVKLMRYNNGYKPFFVDMTFDACRFLRNPNKNPIIKLFYQTYKDSSNLNHTCPYDHDLIVDHFWTGNWETDFAKYIPTLNGDFGVFTEWTSDNITRGFVNIYVRVSGRKPDF